MYLNRASTVYTYDSPSIKWIQSFSTNVLFKCIFFYEAGYIIYLKRCLKSKRKSWMRQRGKTWKGTSLSGKREKDQSGATQTVNHADEQCCLFAHISMRKERSGHRFHLFPGWMVRLSESLFARSMLGRGNSKACHVRIIKQNTKKKTMYNGGKAATTMLWHITASPTVCPLCSTRVLWDTGSSPK